MRVQCDHTGKGGLGTRLGSQRDSVLTGGIERTALPSPHFPGAITQPGKGARAAQDQVQTRDMRQGPKSFGG